MRYSVLPLNYGASCSILKYYRKKISFLHPDPEYDGLADQGGDAGAALPADTVVEGVAEDQIAVVSSKPGNERAVRILELYCYWTYS